MPLPSVALDPPAELSLELVGAALTSCNRALGQDRCVLLYDGQGPKPEVSWIATLRYAETPKTAVRVELRTTPFPGLLTAVRQLEFQPSDAATERWAAVGVVVAALVTVEENTRPTPDGTPPPETSPPRKPTPPRVSVRKRAPIRKLEERPVAAPSGPRFGIDLAMLGGPGLDTGPWRVGGQLRLLARPPRLPWRGWASVTVSGCEGTVSSVWSSGAAGGGLVIPTGLSWAALEGRVGVLGTWASFSAENAIDSDHTARWRWGAVSAADVLLLASSSLNAVVTFEATATWPSVVVRREDAGVGREPPVEWTTLAGLRWIL
jgi:hypothetical protein